MLFFFFKQKTAYEVRISDWSSDVCSSDLIANFEMVLLNMREGGMISAHDYKVARSAAVALCGGAVDAGTRVDEEWLLAVERREFVALLRTPETQARIRHTLETGKPLRN